MSTSNGPMLSEDAKRELLTRRIMQMEADKFNYELSLAEMAAVQAEMGERTDATAVLKEAQTGLEAVTVRLRTLREVWSKTFPSEDQPPSGAPS